MSPEANKITLCDITNQQLALVMRLYHHFSTQYEFYAAAQMQTIIKTESASFSSTNVALTYTVIFVVRYPGSVR